MRCGFSLLAGRNGKTKKGKLGAAKLPPVASASSLNFARASIIESRVNKCG